MRRQLSPTSIFNDQQPSLSSHTVLRSKFGTQIDHSAVANKVDCDLTARGIYRKANGEHA